MKSYFLTLASLFSLTSFAHANELPLLGRFTLPALVCTKVGKDIVVDKIIISLATGTPQVWATSTIEPVFGSYKSKTGVELEVLSATPTNLNNKMAFPLKIVTTFEESIGTITLKPKSGEKGSYTAKISDSASGETSTSNCVYTEL